MSVDPQPSRPAAGEDTRTTADSAEARRRLEHWLVGEEMEHGGLSEAQEELAELEKAYSEIGTEASGDPEAEDELPSATEGPSDE